MKTFWFIRHAESLSNAGLPTETPHAIGLTEKGHRQGQELAAHWNENPDLIVVSPYLRTAATAAPLCSRLPQVPVLTLPVHEFTFLAPSAYAGTTESLRREPVRQYWERCDPDYCHGEGAESFRAFCHRIDTSIEDLLQRPERFIAVFCHGYVIKAILWRQSHVEQPVTTEYMRGFLDFHRRVVVPNTQIYPFNILPDGQWVQQPSLTVPQRCPHSPANSLPE